MKRRQPSQQWTTIATRPRWGCLAVALFFALLATGVLVLFLWLLRPSRALRPQYLIGSDVDGLALIELSRSSSRVNRLLRVLVRPLAYEVQSHPEDLGREIARMLDVMTYRQAVGLLRFDPETEREQWAWVVALKRMGSPLKVLVRQWTARDPTGAVETVTSGGALLFWGKNDALRFAIARGAFVVANDRAWLQEILARADRPPAKAHITPRANRLCAGLPEGGKHCIARACILVTPRRWEHWATGAEEKALPARTLGRLCRVLDASELAPPALESITVAATVAPRGRLRLDLTAACPETSPSLAAAKRLRERWPELAPILSEPDTLAAVEPTTAPAGLRFGWNTSPIEQLLGFARADRTTPTR